MEEDIKVNFSKPMLVLKIRDVYKAPYHKNKYITISRKIADSKSELVKFLSEFTKNWSSGTYELQFLFQERDYVESNIYSTFMRFDVRSGKIVKVWKNSPYSKKEYPVWKGFKPEKPVKKKKSPPKAVKKAKKTNSKQSKKTLKSKKLTSKKKTKKR